MKEITLTLSRQNLKNLIEGRTVSTLGTEERPRVVVKIKQEIVEEFRVIGDIMAKITEKVEVAEKELGNKDPKQDQELH